MLRPAFMRCLLDATHPGCRYRHRGSRRRRTRSWGLCAGACNCQMDGTFGHLACVGVDAAGQVNCQHNCAVFPLAVYQCAGGQPGRAQTAVEPGTVQGVYHGVKGLCRQGRSVTVSRSMRMRSPTSRCIWAVRWKRRRNWQTVCLPCCTAPATTIMDSSPAGSHRCSHHGRALAGFYRNG